MVPMGFTWAAGNFVEISKPSSWGPSHLQLPKGCNVNHSLYRLHILQLPRPSMYSGGSKGFPGLT